MGVHWVNRCYLATFLVSQRDFISFPLFYYQNPIVSPCSMVTILCLPPWRNYLFYVETLYFSFNSLNVSCTYIWILLIFLTNILALKESPLRSSLTPPCYPHSISKCEGGKYPKQVSNWVLLVEVWSALL